MKLFRRKDKNKNRAGADPPAKRKVDKKLVAVRSPESYEAEQFRVLKTKIFFPQSGGEPPRSIMVTSAFKGVGKSFVSANLAVSMAQSIDQHVFLMDCDLRRPSVHKLFGYKKVAGLSEYLTNDTPLSAFLLKTMAPKLTLLPAGAPPPNPAELLSSKKMKDLFEEVKNRYDDRYIIVDSPPLRVAAEAEAVMKRVDAVILVVGYGETPKESVTELAEIIGKDKIASIVVNQCNSAVNYWGVQKHYYGYNK
jgi:protein-tyrosine kinase